MEIIAYQTLEDRDNIDQIETDGPFECRRNSAWLGYGYYFWDTNMEWAINWGETAYKRERKEYVIGRCGLNLATCFDLFGNVGHQMDLTETIEVMKDSGLIKSHHKFLLPNIIQYLKQKGLFNYKSIRAADNHTNVFKLHFRNDKPEYMFINQRVQVCVIERKDVILHPFKVIYPEKYLI